MYALTVFISFVFKIGSSCIAFVCNKMALDFQFIHLWYKPFYYTQNQNPQQEYYFLFTKKTAVIALTEKPMPYRSYQ